MLRVFVRVLGCLSISQNEISDKHLGRNCIYLKSKYALPMRIIRNSALRVAADAKLTQSNLRRRQQASGWSTYVLGVRRLWRRLRWCRLGQIIGQKSARLAFPKRRIVAAVCQQFGMGSAFYDAPFVQHDQPVQARNRR